MQFVEDQHEYVFTRNRSLKRVGCTTMNQYLHPEQDLCRSQTEEIGPAQKNDQKHQIHSCEFKNSQKIFQRTVALICGVLE